MSLEVPSSNKDILYFKKGFGKLCIKDTDECVLCCDSKRISFFNVPIFNSGYFHSEEERSLFIETLYDVLKDNFVMFKHEQLSDNDCRLLFNCIETFIIALTDIKKTSSIKNYITSVKKYLKELM